MKKAVLVLLLACLVTSFASAEMFVSSPNSVYNVGDEFMFNVTIIPSVTTNSFFTAKIICVDNGISGEIEMYKSPLSLKMGSQKEMDISGKFDNFVVGTLKGDCHLQATFGESGAASRHFELTRNINVNVGTNKALMVPGDRFDVSGKGIKGNGEVVKKGFVEIKIEELNVVLFKTIENGDFTYLIDIPEKSAAGDYNVTARVYEKDDGGEITNEGSGYANIRIKQVITRGELAISEQSVVPGSDFTYTVLLYDQTDEEIADSAEVSIYKPDGSLLAQKLVKTGEADTIKIEKNYAPGTWKVESQAGGIISSRTFVVEELEEMSFEVVDGTLIAVNTGNVPYKKNVEIKIGNASVVKEVFADVGETRRFALSAPDGNYEVEVDADGEKTSLGTSFLTGRAVGVESEDDVGFFRRSYIILWIMLISLGILLAVYQYDKIAKKSYYGKTPAKYPEPIKLAVNPSKENIISEGSREECSVISLRIKNFDDVEKMKGDGMAALERALTRARDARAKIYSDSKGYKTMVLAPSLTNEKDNSMKAVSIAHEIESVLLEHNKRFGDKIMFGIGVHNGEMIIERLNGQFKFNSIGSTMPYVKKIADTTSYGVGVSEFVHRRILGKVKSDRIEGTNYWRIAKVRDSGLHSEFINKFVEKQKREGMFKR